MQQLTATSAAPRLLRHARRALLLIGAAFVWWLVFSGGPAQAHDAGSAHAGVEPLSTVTQTTTAVTDRLRAAPKRVSDTLATTTQTAPQPVREVVASLDATLQPTLRGTTTTAADTVDVAVGRTVETVRPAVATVTGAVAAAAPVAPLAPVASAPQPHKAPASTARHHRAAKATTAGTTAGRSFVATAYPAHAPDVHVGHAEGPAGGVPGGPAAPVVPVAPAGSSAPSIPLAALGLFVIAPPAVRRRRLLAGRPLRRYDPAYTPGCSPD